MSSWLAKIDWILSQFIVAGYLNMLATSILFIKVKRKNIPSKNRADNIKTIILLQRRLLSVT